MDAARPRVDFDVEVLSFLNGPCVSAWVEAGREARIQCWYLDVQFQDGTWDIQAGVTLDNELMPDDFTPKKVQTFDEVEVEVGNVLEQLMAVPWMV